MQRKICIGWLSALLSLAITAFSGCAFRAENQLSAVQGDVELLRMVAEGWRSNREKIKTWQGTANVLSESSLLPKNERVEKSVVDFACDGNLGAKRSNWERLEVQSTNPEDDGAPEHMIRNCMVRGDAFYQFGPIYPETSDGPYVLLVYSADQKNVDRFGYSFDPFSYFNHGDSDVAEIFMDHYLNRDKLPGAPEAVAAVRRKVMRQGNLVALELTSEQGTNEYVVDTSQGCNLISYCGSFEEGRYEESLNIDYRQTDGVFVPVRVISDVYHARPNVGITQRHREVVFTKFVINQPLPPEKFELAALGLLDGDRVKDMRDGTFYEFSAVPPVSNP